MIETIKRKWLENKAWLLLSHPEVKAVNIGTKITGGIDTGRQCIKAYVKKKKKSVPKKFIVPNIWLNEPTDVEEIGHITKLIDRRKYDPLVGGCEIGIRGYGEVGTLGCIFTRRTFNGLVLYGKFDMTNILLRFGLSDKIKTEYVGLTNKHVVTKSMSENPKGNEVIQPYYGGSVIGKVIDYDNRTDSALILCDPSIRREVINNRIIRIGDVYNEKPLDNSVKKYGRTSEFTEGKLAYDKMWVKVDYGTSDGYRIYECMAFKMSSTGGDSGSIITSSDGCVMALLFAGSDQYTFGIDIKKVFGRYMIDGTYQV